MKKIVLFVTLIVVILCSAWTANPGSPEPSKSAQFTVNVPVPSFAYFRIHKLGNNGVKAHWAMASTSGVTDFIVQRTYEDPTDPYSPWDDICNMPCGNAKLYKHDDMGLFPGFVSYRVVAMNNGTQVAVSEFLTIQILQQL